MSIPGALRQTMGERWGFAVYDEGMQPLQLRRKVWHASVGILFCILYTRDALSRDAFAVGLAGLTVFYLLGEAARFGIPSLNRWFTRVTSPMIRDHERQGLHSGVPYAAACATVVWLFPKPVAILSILYLAIGDPLAALVGQRWGHLGPRLTRRRTLIGTLAGVSACGILTAVLTHDPYLTAIGALAGGLAELVPVPIPVLGDDNFVIPLVSACVLQLAIHML